MRWGDNSNDPGRRRIRFPRSVKNKLFAAQQGRCAYCGQSHHPRYLRIDHKYPFSRGGSDDFDNLQILCNPCNMRKGILSDEEFRHRYQRLLPTDGSIPLLPFPKPTSPRKLGIPGHPRKYVPFSTNAFPLTVNANAHPTRVDLRTA